MTTAQGHEGIEMISGSEYLAPGRVSGHIFCSAVLLGPVYVDAEHSRLLFPTGKIQFPIPVEVPDNRYGPYLYQCGIQAAMQADAVAVSILSGLQDGSARAVDGLFQVLHAGVGGGRVLMILPIGPVMVE